MSEPKLIAESPGPDKSNKIEEDGNFNPNIIAVLSKTLNLRNIRAQFEVDQLNHHFRVARKTDSFII